MESETDRAVVSHSFKFVVRDLETCSVTGEDSTSTEASLYDFSSGDLADSTNVATDAAYAEQKQALAALLECHLAATAPAQAASYDGCDVNSTALIPAGATDTNTVEGTETTTTTVTCVTKTWGEEQAGKLCVLNTNNPTKTEVTDISSLEACQAACTDDCGWINWSEQQLSCFVALSADSACTERDATRWSIYTAVSSPCEVTVVEEPILPISSMKTDSTSKTTTSTATLSIIIVSMMLFYFS